MGFFRGEKVLYIIITLLIGTNTSLYSQNSITKNGLEYVITTAVPFLRIGTDARASGMAEVGVSTSADVNSAFHNPAKFAFIEKDKGASINFAPWLRQITNDIYLLHANGYMKLAPNHTASLGFKYFTLGEINYRDANNGPLGISKPYEFALDGHYAFRLSENLSIGAGGRFILSDLSNGATQTQVTIPVGTAFAVDLGMFYSKKLDIRNLYESKLNFGFNISNIGSKIQYSNTEPDYIPTNLSIGATFEGASDEHNSFSGTLQFDKLLVPNPTYKLDNQGKLKFVDANTNGIPDFKEYSSISGILTSFGDNGDGISGELKEFIVHLGAEYAYEKTYFARAGFFYEPDAAGGRQYVTAGIGLKYNVMKLDFSYLLPITQQKSPLDNQMRVSVSFNVGETKQSSYW